MGMRGAFFAALACAVLLWMTAAVGAIGVGRAVRTDPEEALGAYHKAEIEKWWPIIKAAHAEPGR